MLRGGAYFALIFMTKKSDKLKHAVQHPLFRRAC